MSSPSTHGRGTRLTLDGRLRVLVIDADRERRLRTKSVLHAGGPVALVGAGTGREALEAASWHRPDVALLDDGLPGLHVTAWIERLVALGVPVVVLDDTGDLDHGVAVLRSGANGVVGRALPPGELHRRLSRVAAGGCAIDGRLGTRVLDLLRSAPDPATVAGHGTRPVRSSLTSREWEVLDLLAAGLGTDDVADAMAVSRETVRSHVKAVLRKLGVHSRAEAVAAAGRLRAGASEQDLAFVATDAVDELDEL